MDAEGILKVLEAIDADHVQEYRRNVQCACVLADYRDGHSDQSTHAGSMGIQINPNDISFVNCFACGFRGTVSNMISALGMYQGRDYSKLLILIDKMEELDPEYIVSTLPEYGQAAVRYEEKILEESLITPMMGSVPKYVLNRGFDLETLKSWEAGYDLEKRRAVFPVRNYHMDLVGMVGRTVNNHKMKYYNYFDFDKSKYLFGEHKIWAKRGVVVEGLLDAVKLWKYFNEKDLLSDDFSPVALLGSMTSRVQAQKLVKHFDEVILFLDNDPSGWTGTMELGRKLFGKVLLRAVRYPDKMGGDPDSLISDGVDIEGMLRDSDLLVL